MMIFRRQMSASSIKTEGRSASSPLSVRWSSRTRAGSTWSRLHREAEPPVCKLLDFGKYKYEAQKKASEARKKQKTIDIKEVKFRPGINEADYEVKLRNIRRFLDEGDKVKVTMRFRGREMVHQNIGMNVLARVRDDLGELAKVEQMPKMEGRQMTMVMARK